MMPQKLISKLGGFLSDIPLPKWFLLRSIRFFVKKYGVNTEEPLHPLSHYRTFNDFFTRTLKPSCRPIDSNANSIVSPVDGKIIEYGNVVEGKALQIKGISYSVNELMIHPQYNKRFTDGHFITLYLSPKDYHRIHCPYDARAIAVEYNKGKLFPVNELGLHHIKQLFTVNERLTTYFETSFGIAAMVKVGAFNVGRIKTNYPLPWSARDMKKGSLTEQLENFSFNKGKDFARFELGSTVILFFEKDRIAFNPGLKSGALLKVGEVLASVCQ